MPNDSEEVLRISYKCFVTHQFNMMDERRFGKKSRILRSMMMKHVNFQNTFLSLFLINRSLLNGCQWLSFKNLTLTVGHKIIG